MDIAGWTAISFCPRLTITEGSSVYEGHWKKEKDHELFINANAAVPVSGIIFLRLCDLSCLSQSMSCLCFLWLILFLKADTGSNAHTQLRTKFKSWRRFHRQIVTRGSTWSCWEWISHGDSRGWVITQSEFCIDPVAQCWYEGGNMALQRATATRCHVTFTA